MAYLPIQENVEKTSYQWSAISKSCAVYESRHCGMVLAATQKVFYHDCRCGVARNRSLSPSLNGFAKPLATRYFEV